MKTTHTTWIETTNKDLAFALCYHETFNADIPLYKSDGNTYCDMLDMLRLIQYELTKAPSGPVHDVLVRLRYRLIRNDLSTPDDDDDVPPYTPEPGCANCAYMDFADEP